MRLYGVPGRAILMVAMMLAAGVAVRAHAAAPAAPAALALQLQPGTTPIEANGTIRFIGTATVPIRYQGFTILTDPTSCTRVTMSTSAMASRPNASRILP